MSCAIVLGPHARATLDHVREVRAKSMIAFDRITSIPTVLNGHPTIRGMRLTVRRVIEALVLWPNRDDLRREIPEPEPEDIRQALAFAARILDEGCSL